LSASGSLALLTLSEQATFRLVAVVMVNPDEQ
jgi:hypothetical protein